jgi:hypothetical protein
MFPASSPKQEEAFQNKHEVVRMENERKATPRQLAYIQQLRRKQGMESIEPDENLSALEASRMIEELMRTSQRNGQFQSVKLNEARLGMVLKEIFRDFRNSEKDILREHRQRFKETVLKTYQLFTEIAKELEQAGMETEA